MQLTPPTQLAPPPCPAPPSFQDGTLTRHELTRALEQHMEAVASAVRELIMHTPGASTPSDPASSPSDPASSPSDPASARARRERALGAVDRLMSSVQREIPSAVQQIFDEVAEDHDETATTTDTINFADWEREWTRHPELLEMMSVESMSAMAAELAGGQDASK